MVKISIEKRLKKVRTLRSSCVPRCVLRYLRDIHNSFHGGASVSFLDKFEDVLVIESKWRIDCELTGVVSKMPNYEKFYLNFVIKSSTNFQSWNSFDMARAVIHFLQATSIYDRFKAWCLACVDFDSPSMDCQQVIQCMYTVLLEVKKTMIKFWDKTICGALFMACCKLCLPTRQRVGQKRAVTVFEKAYGEAIERVAWLSANMIDCVTFKRMMSQKDASNEIMLFSSTVSALVDNDAPRADAATAATAATANVNDGAAAAGTEEDSAMPSVDAEAAVAVEGELDLDLDNTMKKAVQERLEAMFKGRPLGFHSTSNEDGGGESSDAKLLPNAKRPRREKLSAGAKKMLSQISKQIKQEEKAVSLGKPTPEFGIEEWTTFNPKVKTPESCKTQESRDKVTVDDWASLMYFLRDATKADEQSLMWTEALDLGAALWTEFLFTQSCCLNGKIYKIYSAFRHELAKVLTQALSLQDDPGNPGVQTTARTMSSKIIEMLALPAHSVVNEPGDEYADKLLLSINKFMAQPTSDVLAFRQWVHSTIDVPIRLQPAAVETSRDLMLKWDDMSAIAESNNLHIFLGHIYDNIAKCINPDYTAFLNDLAELYHIKTGTWPEDAAALFNKKHEILEESCSLRVRCVFQILKEMSFSGLLDRFVNAKVIVRTLGDDVETPREKRKTVWQALTVFDLVQTCKVQ